ncbi:polysaccharide biosynthesis protein (plasmid) [Paracoccus pantotrophus]|uniref:polysaccharide biosynthesis protein n=1 Tax=Paracoccus pantotrophus TaxID=82367 RepID=UPI0011C03DE9|nr:polysaccharide biosynthesis protein [Paracoccus pantotrophus]WGR66118.1 polysaccharide biosynthesis protein [Paracoccus pantotrophus]
MNLILHIGMGKTGTSAIQAALSNSTDRLAAQGAEYLGMWFDMLDPRFRGVQNQEQFFSLPPEEMIHAADLLVEVLRIRSASGVQSFILSNEALSGKVGQMKPMINRLREAGIVVRVIGYARNPVSWLPSAYVQWGVRDKVEPGPVQPYSVRARKLVHWYSGLLHWHRQMGDILEVRSYDKATDIVTDFVEAIGFELNTPEQRVLERGEDAEIVMRALFNNRFPKHVLPAVFDRAVLPTLDGIPKLEDVISASFDYSETDQIICEQAALFDEYMDAFGFDPRAVVKSPPAEPEITALRNRLFDVLLEVTLDQAQRIRRLEQRINKLEVEKVEV